MKLLPIHEWGFSSKEESPFFIISGPCSAETEAQVIATAQELAALKKVRLLRAGVWKPRTRPGSFEGVGEPALAWLQRAKRETGLPFSLEVATARHVELALEAGADVLWIGARTSVNPFAVQEIADVLRGTDTPVLVKNPVNPDLELWLGAIERLHAAGLRRIAAVHRGFSVYNKGRYRNAPLWEIPVELRRRLPNMSIVCDPSHIAGDAELLLEVAQMACDLGSDGLMLETHCDPKNAWSDAKQQITPAAFGDLLQQLALRKSDSTDPIYQHNLDKLRTHIDRVDYALLDLLAERMRIVRQIGEYKQEQNIAIVQMERWAEIFRSRTEAAQNLGLSAEFVAELLASVHKESIRQQSEIMTSYE